ncbi:hypothetical protein R1flu_004795 [Riccia fluitans]|uniref:Uncharacterized protein n=1 Tax=Riccia fluitans TaxID=41844 RepID=A0ABD1YRB5_9MARC
MLTSWIGSPGWRRASLSVDRVLTSLRSCVVKQMDLKRASSAQGCGAQPTYRTRRDAESGVLNSQRFHVERSAIPQWGVDASLKSRVRGSEQDSGSVGAASIPQRCGANSQSRTAVHSIG